MPQNNIQWFLLITSLNMICCGWALRSQTKPINTFTATIKSVWRLLLSLVKIYHLYLLNIVACNTAFCHWQLFDSSVNVSSLLNNTIPPNKLFLINNFALVIIGTAVHTMYVVHCTYVHTFHWYGWVIQYRVHYNIKSM